jgi:hypothetical protein
MPRPVIVEYTPALLDSIRAQVPAAADAEETGGILFGTRSGRMITVTDMRPVVTSHLGGPAFTLTGQDRVAFEQVLALPRTEPSLQGTAVVGWYLTHTRDSLVLRPSDREIFDLYFGDPWQVTLVVRPGQTGWLRAATIGRHEDTIEPTILATFTIRQAGDTLMERETLDVLVPSDVVRVRAATVPPEAETGLALPATILEIEPHPTTLPAPSPAPPVQRPTGGRAARLQPLIAAVGVFAAAGVGFWYLHTHSRESLGLIAFRQEGIFRVEWNAAARPIARAAGAKLEVVDGADVTLRDLSREDLKRGLWATLCRRSDCTAKLQLYDKSGILQEELARFVGRAPNRDISQLEQEKAELRDALEREQERSRQLANRLRTLQRMLTPRPGR